MTNSILSIPFQFYRRLTGAAGYPTGLLAGQAFHNEVENVLYVGIGSGGTRADGAILAGSVLKLAGVGAFLDLASAQIVAGKKTFTISPAVPNGVAAGDAAAFGQIAAALTGYAALAGSAFTGGITVPTPSNANDSSSLVPNTAWVQALLSQIVQGFQTKPTATGATTSALPAYTYANGSAGVGATLTGNAVGALPAVDTGYTPATGDFLLVKNETGANAPYNGPYAVTAAGSGSTPYKLTRHIDMDQTGEFAGALVPVGPAGQTNANSIWLCNPAGAVTVGTTALPFTELNSATQLLAPATSGLNIAGNTISISGFSAVPAGALFKMNPGQTAFVPAVAGTDYALPYTGIDSGAA